MFFPPINLWSMPKQLRDYMTDHQKALLEARLKEQKHGHYYKDVLHLSQIDVYRVLDLYDVTHPCPQHAIKKIMCAGARGAKDVDKDIQEAIDTLIRWQEMRHEDGKATSI